jgi:hypothetical protein
MYVLDDRPHPDREIGLLQRQHSHIVWDSAEGVCKVNRRDYQVLSLPVRVLEKLVQDDVQEGFSQSSGCRQDKTSASRVWTMVPTIGHLPFLLYERMTGRHNTPKYSWSILPSLGC